MYFIVCLLLSSNFSYNQSIIGLSDSVKKFCDQILGQRFTASGKSILTHQPFFQPCYSKHSCFFFGGGVEAEGQSSASTLKSLIRLG